MAIHPQTHCDCDSCDTCDSNIVLVKTYTYSPTSLVSPRVAWLRVDSSCRANGFPMQAISPEPKQVPDRCASNHNGWHGTSPPFVLPKTNADVWLAIGGGY